MRILDINSKNNDIDSDVSSNKFLSFLSDLTSHNIEYTCSLYMGFPGSGKSTFAAYLAKKYIKHSRSVYSNFPIKGCYQFSPLEDFGKFSLEKNSLLIIDEAGFDYDCRSFSKFPEHNKYGFKFHRHMCVDIVLFSQSDDVDKKIRDLCRSIYYMSKPWHYFITKCFKRITFVKKFDIDPVENIPRFMWIKVPFWAGGTKYIFGPLVWQMFDSYTIRDLPIKEFKRY